MSPVVAMKSLSFWADFRQPANEVAILNSDTRRLVDSALPVEQALDKLRI